MKPTYIALLNSETGEIENMTTARGDTPLEGHTPDGHYIKIIYDSIESIADFMSTRHFDFAQDVFIERDPAPNYFCKWSSSVSNWILDEDKFYSLIRAERDRRLAETDWYMLPDTPLTEDDRFRMQLYRQDLRDFPLIVSISNAMGLTNLSELPWPIRPSI